MRVHSDFRYASFLNGPGEEHAPEPYKTMIKQAFPGSLFYDYEERDAGVTDWLHFNYDRMQESKTMVTMACPLTMAGCAQAHGIYFGIHSNGLYLPSLITIWPKELDSIELSNYGKEHAAKMGPVVETTEEAIEKLKPFLEFVSH